MSDIAIRDARPDDRPWLVHAMAALQDHERGLEPNRLPGAEMAEEHLGALEAWAEREGGAILIAERDGRRAGFILCAAVEAFGTYVLPQNHRYGQISDLWVAPDARRSGVARALLSEAEVRLAAAGLHRVEIAALAGNAAAIDLYRAAGYGDYEVVLAKPLTETAL